MLLALGIDHKTAPIEIREQLAFSKEMIPNALNTLINQIDVEELALLSTCNRTEIYCVSRDLPIQSIKTWWQQRSQSIDLNTHLYAHVDINMVSHLMRLACGLESMMIGETQILNQLKQAYELAKNQGLIGKRLSRLFQSSFAVAKQVRTNTLISSQPTSVAFAAITLAKQIFSDLAKARVLLIGAGENIELILQHLQGKVAEFYIVNRTVEHAQALTERFGGMALSMDKLSWALGQSDIVLSSVSSQAPILTEQHVIEGNQGRKRRPIFMVDLGLPRNIEPRLKESEDIYLYTIDDLKDIVAENIKARHLAAHTAALPIAKAAQAYMDWLDSHQQIHSLKALREKADSIKEEALSAALKKLQSGERAEDVLTQFAHRLTQRLLHQPRLVLKNKDKSEDKIALAKELLGIE